MSDRDTLTEIINAASFQAPSYSACAADAVIAAGWRPPAREITTVEERDALPVGSIVVDFFEAGCTRISTEPPYGWVRVSSALTMGRQYGVPHLPVTVVYVPTEEADCPHDSRSGDADGRWRCDECGTDCGANTYLTEEGR